MNKNGILGATLLSLGTLALGCDNRAVVKVEMTNTTSSALEGNPSGPAAFAVRLSRIYLSESIDANQQDTGGVSVVWQNPDCTVAGGCSFFDLTRSTRELNRKLDSDPVLARPGSYRFVRLEICDHATARPNIEWKTAQMAATREVTHGWCAVTSKAFDPPITLDAGEAVTIDLAYDLSKVTAPMPATMPTAIDKNFADCDSSAAPQATCMSLPTLVPTVRKFQ